MSERAQQVLRVGLVADLTEEGWPSMDLVAEMLESRLAASAACRVDVTLLRAPFVRRLPRGEGSRARTFDRVVNRFWDYPRWLRRHGQGHDVYHVLDHSYAHLVSELPPARTVAFCHDADAFRALLGAEPDGSLLPRALSRRVLRGLRAAAGVLCISEATRADLADNGLVPAAQLRVVPLGVHPSCSDVPDAAADRAAAGLLGATEVFLLHVGSTIPRKRIDVLLRVFAAVRTIRPDVRLVRVGGRLTPAQGALARRLGVRGDVLDLPFLDRSTLAALFRRAALVLLTSEREGFGLPIVEALACGTPVVASDLPVCREVAGEAATYCGVEDVDGWTHSVLAMLAERDRQPDAWRRRRQLAIARGSMYSWQVCADACASIYAEVVAAAGPSRT